MKIAEAKQRLIEIADGKYHSMEYIVDDHGNGKTRQTCKVYIMEYGFFEAAHWEAALAQLADAVGGKPVIGEDLPTSKDRAAFSDVAADL